MQDKRAIPYLISVLKDKCQEPMVRHEAGLRVGVALFRHKIAFVLGELQRSLSVKSLTEALEDISENEMVRHECAEALGTIATPECLEVLQKYLHDHKRVVKESCEIALDMWEYENSLVFQYADTLLKVM